MSPRSKNLRFSKPPRTLRALIALIIAAQRKQAVDELLRQQSERSLEVERERPEVRTRVRGTISYVYPEIDQVTRMFRVKIRVPGDGGRVQPGLFARAQIDLPRRSR